MIPGLGRLETIYEGSVTRVHRARRDADERPVIVKTLAGEYPSPEERARLRLEYDLLRSFDDPGIVRPLELLAYGKNLALLLEDIGAGPLYARIEPGGMAVEDFLDLAIRMATLLGRIHRLGLIHKDVNPANFVYNPETGRLQIIDFDIASRLEEERVESGSIRSLEGTLPYIAPEQTGRMNRALDWRADFYGLGATYFEMLTGRTPFESGDALELVHQHLAVPPPSARDFGAEVPEAVAAIVDKLLAKSAEDRYQGAFGLVQDLERCQREWRAAGRIQPFEPGLRDVSDRFHIPQRLYGRDREVDRLLESFSRASRGRAELMLVAGAPGIGKSMLVNEVQVPMVERRGHVIGGKFDQLQRSQPYSAIAAAFGELLRQVLSEPESRVESWRERIQAALDKSGRVLVEILPDLERLVGPQPDLPVVGGREARNRLGLVFRRFAATLASPEHPMVLFLDDLQWADMGSLDLMQQLLADPDLEGLLVIGAYRDTEVHGGHPLVRMLETMREAGVRIEEIALSPMDERSVTELVSDATGSPAIIARELARLIVDKTAGNPFFLRQFLRQLVDDGHLAFVEDMGGWQWDLEAIARLEITDNVVELVMRRMLELDEDSRELLQLAACVGNRFDLASLALVAETSPAATARALLPALEIGQVLPLGSGWRRFLAEGAEMEDLGASDIEFRFAHDRVHQAAYALIPAERKARTHLGIGRALEQRMLEAPAVEPERCFEVVSHLNRASDLLETDAERQGLAEHNLRAGRLAKESAAYDSAFRLLRSGIELLGPDPWSTRPELCLDLHREAADAAIGDQALDAAHRLAALVIERAPDPVAAVPAYCTRIEAYSAGHQLADAVRIGAQGLEGLGLTLDLDADEASVARSIAEVSALIEPLGREGLLALPPCEDPQALAVMRLLGLVVVPITFVNGNAFVDVVAHMLRRTIQDGIAPASPFALALYANLLCGPLQQYAAGYEMGRTGVEMMDRLDSRTILPTVTVTFETSVRHWRDHQAHSLEGLQRACQAGIEVGDFEFAMLNGVNHGTQLLLIGRPLDQVEEELGRMQDMLERILPHGHLHSLRINRQAVANLLGQSGQRIELSGAHFDARSELPALRSSGDTTHLLQVAMFEATEHLIYGEFDAARDKFIPAIEEIFRTGWRGTMWVPLLHFYGALAILHAEPEADRRLEESSEALAACLAGLRGAAESAPMNYGHKLDLVEAELARIDGQVEEALRRYESAIGRAAEQGYLQDEALAAELAGHGMLEMGFDRLAEVYLGAAVDAWQAWGAATKVDEMRERFNFLRERRRSSRSGTTGRGETTRTNRTRTLRSLTQHGGLDIDLTTVLKASQAISGQIELRRLQNTLLQVTMENAGADAGALIDLREGRAQVVAAYRLDQEPQPIEPQPIEDSREVSAAVLRYAMRVGESVVLSDASKVGRFTTDPHLRRVGARSVLCLPIRHQGEIQALLYLENSEASDVFTPDRLELLSMLSGQIAISLENARLYQRLRRLNESFARFVPEGFLAFLQKGSVTDVALGDQVERRMSLLFSDVRGFTARAERVPAARTFALLNDYLGRMVPVIEARGGVIDKYVGDAIMALFPEPGGADAALQAALDMLRQRDQFNQELVQRGESPLAMGIGLHTGTVMLGTIGSEARMDGTVIGDTVNLASRMEGVTRQYGLDLVLSGDTHRALDFPSNYLLREIDRVQVVGRDQPVDVYEVFEADPPARAGRKRESLPRLAAVVAAYRARDFETCESECRLLQLLDPEDEVAAMYLRRCEVIREHGLPPDDELVAVLTEK